MTVSETESPSLNLGLSVETSLSLVISCGLSLALDWGEIAPKCALTRLSQEYNPTLW